MLEAGAACKSCLFWREVHPSSALSPGHPNYEQALDNLDAHEKEREGHPVEDIRLGSCRRFPPVIHATSSIGRFPLTWASDCCGEWWIEGRD